MGSPVASPEVLRAGRPELYRRSRPFAPGEWDHPDWRFVFRRMYRMMLESGGVGLAGPQLGLNVRALVYQVRRTPRYPRVSTQSRPRFLINPEFLESSDSSILGTEGCLSFPSLRGTVPRAREVKVRGLDRVGREVIIEATGFEARILQHEIDHLNGVVYPSRIRDFDEFGYTDLDR